MHLFDMELISCYNDRCVHKVAAMENHEELRKWVLKHKSDELLERMPVQMCKYVVDEIVPDSLRKDVSPDCQNQPFYPRLLELYLDCGLSRLN